MEGGVWRVGVEGGVGKGWGVEGGYAQMEA